MNEWISLQKRLFKQVQRDLKGELGKKSKQILEYEKSYRKDMRALHECSFSKLTQAVNSSDVCFIGDFHTLRQSQRLLLRMLKDPKLKKPKALAFEVFRPEDIPLLQRFLKKSSPKLEREILSQTKIESHWGSSWTVYKEILEFAKLLNIKIFGLHKESGSLSARDRFAVKVLESAPAGTWVLFGEFHCSRNHLPQKLQDRKPEAKLMVLQQNEDRLALKNLDFETYNKQVLFTSAEKSKIPLFCILHTPLWVKWQSYLDHYVRRDEGAYAIDAHDQIVWSMKTLYKFLDDPRYPKPVDLESLLDFAAIGVEDEDLSTQLKRLSLRERKQSLSELEHIRVSCSPRHKRIFLSEVTVNSCSQAAANYIYRSWIPSASDKKSFFHHSLEQSLCFFLSKILNHSRKTKTWKQWKQLSRKPEEKELALSVLNAKDFISNFQSRREWTHSLEPHGFASATFLGRILADAAFEAFLSGELSKQRIIRLVTTDCQTEVEAYERLVELRSLGRSFETKPVSQW